MELLSLSLPVRSCCSGWEAVTVLDFSTLWEGVSCLELCADPLSAPGAPACLGGLESQYTNTESIKKLRSLGLRERKLERAWLLPQHQSLNLSTVAEG